MRRYYFIKDPAIRMNVWQLHRKAWITTKLQMNKKPDTKGYILWVSIYIMLKSKPNYPVVLEVRAELVQGRVLCLRSMNEGGFSE